MATITIFYGEMGSGKSYRARRFALNLGIDFYEGDDAVTPAMKKCILVRPIPKDVLEDFLFNSLTPAIHERAREVPHLVVAQALYSREHRLRIKDALQTLGHNVQYILVKVPTWQNVRQLLTRKRGPMWVAYWAMNHFFFEEEMF